MKSPSGDSTVLTEPLPPETRRKGGPRRGNGLLLAGAIGLAAIVGAWAWRTGGRERVNDAKPLPVGPAVPDFSLIRQDGVTVTRETLMGQVWVADFIFTRCAGPCPEISARMRSVQLALAERRDQVRLVSFSLDPKFDTPSVLRHYAKRFHADAEMWWFLTGQDETTVHDLVRRGFLQTVMPATEEEPLIHSNYLLVIDRAGRIRASHDGLDPTAPSRVVADVEALLAESPVS